MVGCQVIEVRQETPKDVVESFIHTWYDVDYQEWEPQYTEYLDSLKVYQEEIKVLFNDDKAGDIESLYQSHIQEVQEWYSNLGKYMSLSTFEEAVLLKTSVLEPRQSCFNYQADSRVTSISYDETFKDEESVGYLISLHYEITPLNGEAKMKFKQSLNLMMKK